MEKQKTLKKNRKNLNVKKPLCKTVAPPTKEQIAEEKETLSIQIFNDFIDECLMEIALEVHRTEKIANTNCQICQTRCRHYSTKPSRDIFNQNVKNNNQIEYGNCPKCQSKVAISKIATHFTKCLGFMDNNRRLLRRSNTSVTSSNSTYTVDKYLSSLDESDGEKEEKKVKRKAYQSSPLKKTLIKKQKSNLEKK
ncbi:hypothetical protein BCR32DRAFT_71316 [Anaeromyces robustus]|uniref:SAGA-associated factor 11 n=1 Tax=Anaeromyces robustus TaxID=1754192 RepID=A0A1Y1XJK5_9FUNG|nr:hypothetical protein BCR32DRAFT_71316 [Anaeromyces robustus]|eukprot:ORX85930.1 hypothetical protein BCR32DRAFT_71316 [Anaeromyces robustus]